MAEEPKKTKSKLSFTAKTASADGTSADPVYFVVRPTRKDVQDAELERSRVFTTLLRSGTLLDKEVDNLARQRNLWDDGCDGRVAAIVAEIRSLTATMMGKVKGTTKAAARAAAIRIRGLRAEMLDIGSERRSLHNLTAESRARDAEFNFLLVRCTRTEDNKPVYASVEDMLTRENDPVFEAAYATFLKLHYGLDVEQTNRELPENAFLLKHGYCDEKLRLIDPVTKGYVGIDGKPVDSMGRSIDEEGHLIDADGVRIDEDGLPAGETFELVD